MNWFLSELSQQYKDDIILLVCDNAGWHKSKELIVHGNIVITHIPPYTPEMNPIEQIWKEIRKLGFTNQVFDSLNKVVDRLCNVINSLTTDCIKSVTHRNWIYSCI
jgi:putative transposase